MGGQMSQDDYTSRQAARDAEYDRAYRAWVQSLPEEERRAMEKAGLHAPSLQRHGTGSASCDAAESRQMREGDDPALLPDCGEDQEDGGDYCEPYSGCTYGQLDEAVRDAVRHVIAEILGHDNARLTAECFALVSGLLYGGDSMAEIARRHGVTRAAVSKRCVELTGLLGLRPSRAMRSLTARRSYRDARIRFLEKS